MRIFRSISILIVSFVASLAFAQAPAYAAATPCATNTPQCQVCQGIGSASANGTCGDNGQQIQDLIRTFINLFSAFVGLAAVLMLVFAGFQFITGGGDPQKVNTARNSVVYAVIGLVLVVFSQLIVHFVLNTIKP